MKLENILWGVLGFGVAVAAVTAVIMYIPIDGQDEEEVIEEENGEENYQGSSGAYFIRIEGIEGEATDGSHEGWCEISSYDHSMISSGGAGSGRTGDDAGSGNSITVTKRVDKASPKLMEACIAGTTIGEVEVDFCNSVSEGGSNSYMRYFLKNVTVSSYSTGGTSGSGAVQEEETTSDDGESEPNDDVIVISQQQNYQSMQYIKGPIPGYLDDRPSETVTLNYEEIKFTYTEMDEEGNSKGNVEYTWKVEEGE